MDTYAGALKLGPKLAKNPLTTAETRKFAKQTTGNLIAAGQTTINAIAAIRGDGVKVGEEIYEQHIATLAAKISGNLIAALAAKDLGITQEKEYQEVISGWYDNDDLRIELRRNGIKIVVAVGPQKGTQLQ